MAQPLSTHDVDRSLDLLRGGAANADGRSSVSLLSDLHAKLTSAGLDDVAATVDALQRALSGGGDGATIGGHMQRLGEQVEAVAAGGDPGVAAPLRELAEHLRREGGHVAG
jgi:hypothetical protein